MSFQQKPLAAALCLLALPCTPALAQSDSDAPIVVTATRQPTRANELLSDVTVLDREAIEVAGPTATLQDLLARQPGIEISTRGGPGTATEVYLRGSSAKQTVVLVDGMRVGSATLGAATWGYLPLQQVDRIEILRGAASSLYGADAIGGVIQVFTRRGDGPLQFNAEAGIGTRHSSAASAGLSGGQNGWRYSLQVANNRTRGFSAIDNPDNGDYNPDKDGYRDSSASGSLSFSPAKDQEFGFNFLYSEGWNDYDSGGWTGTADAAYRQDQKLASYSLYARNRLAERWLSTLRVGRSSDDSRQFMDDDMTGKIRTEQTQYQWQNDLALPVGSALLAIERLEQKVSGDQEYDVNKRTINSVLAGWNGSLGDHRLQFNLRRDDNSQFGAKNTGFAAYGYQFTPSLRASVSYGTAFNAPTFNDLYWPDAGNPDLKPEQAKNRELAIHYETGGHHTSATFYRNDVTDLINWAPISPGSWTWIPQNVSSARLSGVTFAYEGQAGGFDIKASADFQDPRDLELDKVLPYRAREHANFSLGRRYGAFDWTVEWQASGRRYADDANTVELAGYALFNLQAGYRFARDWSVFARANNIFDRDYVQVQDYATPGADLFVGIRYAPK